VKKVINELMVEEKGNKMRQKVVDLKKKKAEGKLVMEVIHI
jgi:hypothetical protein